jgi:hypothetical protein
MLRLFKRASLSILGVSENESTRNENTTSPIANGELEEDTIMPSSTAEHKKRAPATTIRVPVSGQFGTAARKRPRNECEDSNGGSERKEIHVDFLNPPQSSSEQ